MSGASAMVAARSTNSGACRPKSASGSSPDDLAVADPVLAAHAEDDRPVVGGVDDDEADARVRDQAGHAAPGSGRSAPRG